MTLTVTGRGGVPGLMCACGEGAGMGRGWEARGYWIAWEDGGFHAGDLGRMEWAWCCEKEGLR